MQEMIAWNRELRSICRNKVIIEQNKPFRQGYFCGQIVQNKQHIFALIFYSYSFIFSPLPVCLCMRHTVNSLLLLYSMWKLHKGIRVIITHPVAVVQRGCPWGCKLLQSLLGQPGPVKLTVDETFGAAGSQERAMRWGMSNLQSIFSAKHLYVYDQ